MRTRYTRAHKTAHRVIFESSSLLPDRATINVFSAVSRASSYYGSPLRCVISLKFCRFYADRIYRWPPPSFRCFRSSSLSLFFIRMRKKICIYIYILYYCFKFQNIYKWNEKSKISFGKIYRAICNVYIFYFLYFIFFQFDIFPRQTWKTEMGEQRWSISMVEILERFRKFEASRVALFADISVSMSNL